MIKEEYVQLVKDTASTFLLDRDAEDWHNENPERKFHDFLDHAEYDGGFTSIVDCEFPNNGWKSAVDILQATEQDPDHVDSGLYEGEKSWKRILTCIAFEVFSWDVREKAEEMYDAGDFGTVIRNFPTNDRQLGFHPKHQTWKLPKGDWLVNLHDAIKVYIPGRRKPDGGYGDPELSVVFEGKVEERGSSFVVQCRRIYTGGGEKSLIKNELQRCRDEFGVKRIRK